MFVSKYAATSISCKVHDLVEAYQLVSDQYMIVTPLPEFQGALLDTKNLALKNVGYFAQIGRNMHKLHQTNGQIVAIIVPRGPLIAGIGYRTQELWRGVMGARHSKNQPPAARIRVPKTHDLCVYEHQKQSREISLYRFALWQRQIETPEPFPLPFLQHLQPKWAKEKVSNV